MNLPFICAVQIPNEKVTVAFICIVINLFLMKTMELTIMELVVEDSLAFGILLMEHLPSFHKFTNVLMIDSLKLLVPLLQHLSVILLVLVTKVQYYGSAKKCQYLKTVYL